MKSFSQFLTEAPMAEYDDSAVGNRRTKTGKPILKKNEKPVSSFSEKDRRLIKSDRTKGKLEKVAAIGVRISNWIAYHGFCLNIKNDLEPFKKIIPCGISDKKVTNLTKISKSEFNKIDEILINKFILNLKNLNV